MQSSAGKPRLGLRPSGKATIMTGQALMNHERVLIVEDEENERTGLAELITSWGYRAETARDGAEGLEKVTNWAPAIVITDMKMPRMGGLELLEKLATDAQTMAVVVVTAQGTIDSAVQAMRMGAYDYITKPIDTNRLRTILQNASALLGTKAELEVTRRKLRDAGSLGSLIGSSKKMQEIFHLIEMVAPSTASVLITGASGTGKELVARTVHELSPRGSKPFIPINCAAIPETLIESEIFGHERGAFTGALERRTGCFELAEGGTLLLDCACSKTGNCGGWEARWRPRWMCACWRPPTKYRRTRWPGASCAMTFTIASTSSIFICRRYGSTRKTFLSWCSLCWRT